MPEKKLKHLEMIESVIERMAKNSFQLKTWTLTLVSIVGALASKDANKRFILLAFIPIIGFWILDSLYIQQERKFKQYYEYVAKKDENHIDFSMDTNSFQKTPEQKKKASFVNCFISFSVIWFYPIIAIALLAVVIAIKCF